MCDFCKNIISKEDYKSLSLYDKVFNLPVSFIIKEEGKYNLWNECEDDFYSAVYLEDIKYCPKCGRCLI